MIRTLAKVFLPVAALAVATFTAYATDSFDVEPDARTAAGNVLAIVVIAVSQAGLAAAPFLGNARTVLRVLVALLMLPSALLLAAMVVELLPKLGEDSRGEALAILAITAAYALAFVLIAAKPHNSRTPERGLTPGSS